MPTRKAACRSAAGSTISTRKRRLGVRRSLSRFAGGNISHVRSVGEGVHEVKVDFGPGYRVYFGWEGKTIVMLLGGGSKKRQDRDIATAHERWAEYKRRK